MLTIYIVSDGRGQTAEQVVHAALVQFQTAQTRLIRRGQVRTAAALAAVVREAAQAHALIFHTLVGVQLRRLMLVEARRYGVDAMDLLGPVLDRLETALQLEPLGQPGLARQLLEAKSRAIEAVEFAFRHDDGQHVEELDQAEIVLTGISRTMKTPTMLYLAYRGWFAANVPIVPEIPLPPSLTAVPRERVFYLSMNPASLADLRRARLKYLEIPSQPYASVAAIRRELQQAEELCHRYGWRPIEISGKSVEEIAAEIALLLGKNRR